MTTRPKPPAPPPGPPPRKTNRTAEWAPAWLPVPYEDADAYALKRLARGEASADEQKRALNWIITQAAGTYDEPYRPGPEGQRDTDFALGKASVGRAIVKLLNLVLRPQTGTREDAS